MYGGHLEFKRDRRRSITWSYANPNSKALSRHSDVPFTRKVFAHPSHSSSLQIRNTAYKKLAQEYKMADDEKSAIFSKYTSFFKKVSGGVVK